MSTQTSHFKNNHTLRFPEFAGEWECKKLDEIAVITMGQSPSSTSYNNQVCGTPFFQGKPSDIDTLGVAPITQWTTEPAKIVSAGTALIAVRAPVGDIFTVDREVCIGRGLAGIKSKEEINQKFLNYYLEHSKSQFNTLSQGSTFSAINSNDIKGLTVNYPEYEIQQKIANFLESTDFWIENLKQQKKNLDKYKKGMMQKIFAQEIRFKDKNGNNFSEWEENRLGEFGKTYSGLTGKNGNDFGKGEYFITYKQIFDKSEIDILRFAFVNVKTNEKQNKAQFGDIFFTISSETPHEVGFSSVLLDRNVSPYLNSFSFGFRPNINNIDPYFAKYFFRSPIFRRNIIKLAQGSTRYNISKIEFIKIKLLLPSFLEQQKIGNFLTSIDNLLISKQQQITHVEQWKKGLMQGLFV